MESLKSPDSIISNTNMTSLNSSTMDYDLDGEPFQFTWQNCVFILLASLMSLTTIIANVLLIILVCVDAKLRRFSNYYIISLACADMLVGTFVIPMFSLYTILGRWPLGTFVCELWIITDFTCVSASVFNICMISLDRYWAITQPLKHLQRQRRQRTLLIVGAIWIVAMFCWTPAVIVNKYFFGSFITGPTCIYLPGFVYVMISNTLIFFFPMITMVGLYAKMLFALKKHLLLLTDAHETKSRDRTYVRKICCCRETSKSESTIASHTGSNQNVSVSTISMREDHPSFDASSMLDRPNGERPVSGSQTHQIPRLELSSYQDSTEGEEMSEPVTFSEMLATSSTLPCKQQSSDLKPQILNTNTNSLYSDDLQKERAKKQRLAKHRLHQRTTRTLGIIVVAFLICWIPFVVLFPINSYCNCIPVWLYDMSYWLAYLNSTLNPFLYGFNKDFRMAFRKLICSIKKS